MISDALIIEIVDYQTQNEADNYEKRQCTIEACEAVGDAQSQTDHKHNEKCCADKTVNQIDNT